MQHFTLPASPPVAQTTRCSGIEPIARARPEPPFNCSRRLRLCFLDYALDGRGMPASAFSYALHAETVLGHESVVLAGSVAQSKVDLLVTSVDHVKEANTSRRALDHWCTHFPVRYFLGAQQLGATAKAAGCDAMYVQHLSAGSHAFVRAVEQAGIPVMFHCMGWCNVKQGSTYAVNSEWAAKRFNTGPVVRFGVSACPKPEPGAAEALRATHNISASDKLLCYMGGEDSFNIKWVIDQLFASVEKVDDWMRTMPSLHLMFMPKLPRGVAQHARFHTNPFSARTSDKAAFYAACDAMIHSRSNGESFGLAVAEFSSCNRPVITQGKKATTAGYETAHLDMLGSKAWTYTAHDKGSLIAQMRRLVDTPKETLERGDWNAHAQNEPSQLMRDKFHTVFIKPTGVCSRGPAVPAPANALAETARASRSGAPGAAASNRQMGGGGGGGAGKPKGAGNHAPSASSERNPASGKFGLFKKRLHGVASCTSGQLFGDAAAAAPFGKVLDLRNVTLSACPWDVKKPVCTQAVEVEHEDERIVDKIKSKLSGCAMTWFPVGGAKTSRLPFGSPIRVVRGNPSSQPPAAHPDEIVFLIDAFGLKVIGHANLDVLFPVATTARALLQADSELDSYDACRRGNARCRVYILSSQASQGASSAAVHAYNRGMQTALLGEPFSFGSEIPRRRYARVIVGWLAQAQPVIWPKVLLQHTSHSNVVHRLWAEFQLTLRAQLGLIGTGATQSYGFWHRRTTSHDDRGVKRSLDADEYRQLRTHACRPAALIEELERQRRSDRGESLGAGHLIGKDLEQAWEQGGDLQEMGGCWLRGGHLHKLPFHDQARALQGARLYGGFEGSNFVNSLFMPPGGIIFMVDTPAHFLPKTLSPAGFMWAFAQYLHRELIFVVAPTKGQAGGKGIGSNHNSTTPGFSADEMDSLGELLRHTWEGGTSAVCRFIERRNGLKHQFITVHTKPYDCEFYGYSARNMTQAVPPPFPPEAAPRPSSPDLPPSVAALGGGANAAIATNEEITKTKKRARNMTRAEKNKGRVTVHRDAIKGTVEHKQISTLILPRIARYLGVSYERTAANHTNRRTWEWDDVRADVLASWPAGQESIVLEAESL